MPSKRPLINLLIITLLALILSAGSSRAQIPGDLDDLQGAIERNAELLDQAAELVMQTQSIKARTSLEAAFALHKSSIQLAQNGQYAQAARAAASARAAILRTINIAKREARLEENAFKAMERAAVRLEQARSAFDEKGGRDDVPARKLLDESHQQLQRAKNHMREHMFGTALQLAQSSIDLSNRAISMLKRDAIDDDAVFRAIERTDRVLERAAEVALDTQQSQRALREAQDMQSRARHNARNDNYRIALEQTRRARDIGLRVLKLAGASGKPDKEQVARAITFTDELLTQAYSIAREHNLGDVVGKLDEAARIQEGAKNQFDGGQLGAAMRMTLRARDMAKRALRASNKPLDPEQVRRALEQTDDALARLREALSGAGDEIAKGLFERSSERQREAWEAFNRDEFRKALALSKVARNLARRALRQLGDESTQ